MSVLSVQRVGKAYRSYASELQRFARWFYLPGKSSEENWVLRDVSFEVQAGECVGLVGLNGAGKSTLLKMIAGTLQPTEGRVLVTGKVAAILELGMGFNPDLTGRQNARHSAGLMGYGAGQIDEAMPRIEQFAEIGEYFDQPSRTYSSGMHSRVAFAVATAWHSDILIVDEALSVGDSYFQHKSFDRIRQLKRGGTTLLFVSHDMGSVRTLCDRVILLGEGGIIKDGLPDEVADYYNAIVAAKENHNLSIEQRRERDGWLLTQSGTGEARIESLLLKDAESGEEVKLARTGQHLVLEAQVHVQADLPSLVLGYMLRDRLGHVVWGSNTWHTRQRLENVRAGSRVKYVLDFHCELGSGSYSFSPALVSSDTHLENNYEWRDNALIFDVFNAELDFFMGTSHLDAKFRIESTPNGQALAGG